MLINDNNKKILICEKLKFGKVLLKYRQAAFLLENKKLKIVLFLGISAKTKNPTKY